MIEFTKTDVDDKALDTHGSATGESSAYFGVYLEPECSTQVAGMVPGDAKDSFVLTNKAQNGTDISEVKNDAQIPYLRVYRQGDETVRSSFTLLSGTYYIKELVAPAGYKLDSETIRAATIDRVTTSVAGGDLSGLYPDNKAKIKVYSSTDANSADTGIVDYKWENTPNVVTLYKIDQYGRDVSLASGGYLELKIVAAAGKPAAKFPTGEDTIRLYQDADKPATRTNGTESIEGYVTYAGNAWTITGLFDTNGQTYTLSEPASAVPANNIIARDFSFTVNENGTITWKVQKVPGSNTDSAITKPDVRAIDLKNFSNNFLNAYHPDVNNNTIALRDVSRYLKDVTLEKIEKDDEETKTPIKDISFEIYRYTQKGADGKPTDAELVIKDGKFVTTDNNGLIQLSELDDGVINDFTGSSLRFGLDVGKYFFHELEKGASDKYRLSDDVYFEITPKDPKGNTKEDYSDRAELQFTLVDGYVTQEGDTGTVANDPVEAKSKTLLLTKQGENTSEKLADTRFELHYMSINDEQTGAENQETIKCITKVETINDEKCVVLYEADDSWNIKTVTKDGVTTNVQPDISRKGTYTLTEVLAHIGDGTVSDYSYITPTKNGTRDTVTMIQFKVDSNNRIVFNEGYNTLMLGATVKDADENPIESGDTTTEHRYYDVTVENKKTTLSVEKKNDIDIESGKKTRDQKSLDGENLMTENSNLEMKILEGDDVVCTLNSENSWEVPEGLLKEDTEYTLRETVAPVGYLTASDITFKIFGSYGKAVDGKSQLYVKDGENWVQDVNIKDNVLTMVDEVIIAPVTLTKFVGDADNYEALPGAKFDVYRTSDKTKLGTAITTADSIIWDSIEAEGYSSKLIFDTNGRVVTASTSLTELPVILQQNASTGKDYTFTEVYAPDKAYNDGKSYTVSITADAYMAYKTESGYDLSKKVKIDTEGDGKLYNPRYVSTVTLTKYDNDEEAAKAKIPGTEFTLYRGSVSDANIYTKASANDSVVASGKFTTDANGRLSISIPEKGTYVLKETAAATGYELDDANEVTFTLTDKSGTDPKSFGYNETNEVKPNGDETGFPNERLKGAATLVKKDADNSNLLDGVVYTLTRTDKAGYWLNGQELVTGRNYAVVKDGKFWKLTETTGGTKGRITITGLNWGNYKLVEKTETDGYVLDTKVLTFEITAQSAQNYKDSTVTVRVMDGTSENVTNTKNALTVIKVDARNDSELTGAQFKLFKVTDGKIATNNPAKFYTAQTAQSAEGEVITAGSTTVYGLTKGKYVLREILAPEGFELAPDIVFEINDKGVVSNQSTCKVSADGTVTSDSTAAKTDSNNAFVELSGTTLTVRDNPIVVRLDKLLADDIPILERGSATFTISGKLVNPTAERAVFTENSFTTEARFVAGETYTINETKAPAGYEVPEESVVIQFSVNEDGTVQHVTADSFLALNGIGTGNELGVAKMTFTDQPIEIELVKVGEDGITPIPEELRLAEFTVEGEMVTVTKDTDGKQTSVSVGNATVTGLTTENFITELSGRLIAGKTYTVTETFAPDGYKLTAPFRFTVNEYGRISAIKEANSEGAFADADGNNYDTLTVKNHPNEITFVKVDTETPLARAKFRLTAVTLAGGTAPNPAFVNLDKYTETQAGDTATDVAMSGTEITWTSTASAQGFTLKNHLIAGVTYQLEEIERVPNHETILSPIEFKIGLDGKIMAEGFVDPKIKIYAADGSYTENSAVNREETKLTVQNPPISGSVVLTKYGREETTTEKDQWTTLPGAVYVVKRVGSEERITVDDVEKHQTLDNPGYLTVNTDGSYSFTETNKTKARTFTTDENGRITITGLPEGDYEFHEVDAPDAYHINKESGDQPVGFSIWNDIQARVTNAQDVDTKINAAISLKKFKVDTPETGSKPLANAVFKVEYKGTHEGTFAELPAKLVTDENGVASLPNLGRGTYRLTELSANGQMLNTVGKTRNTITFEIGNEIGKEYVINSDSEYSRDGEYIELEEDGVHDYPIPTKDITVTKKWVNDNGMTLTFRPESVSVQLYRVSGGTEKEPVQGQIELSESTTIGTDDSTIPWSYTWTGLPAYVNVPKTEGSEYITYLYTYTVEEADTPAWYKVDYTHVTEKGNAREENVEDGNTAATVTNTLNGGDEAKILSITKALGGGSEDDVFYVRVKLTDADNHPIGNNANGYYLDPCDVYRGSTNTGTVTPDSTNDYYMPVKSGETIKVRLPKGVKYEVEEKQSGGSAAVKDTSAYTYTTRYEEATYKGTINGDVSTTIRNVAHKYINIAKVNTANETLSGAEYRLVFTPLGEDDGFDNDITNSWTTREQCTVNDEGRLTYGGTPIDITAQGTYKIYETKAPAGYITPTDKDGNPILLATVTVGSADTMSVAVDTGNNGYAIDLMTARDAAGIDNGTVAGFTLLNNPTKAYFGKTIDYAKDQQHDAQEGKALSGAKLKIVRVEDSTEIVGEWTTGASFKMVDNGVLTEDVLYKLIETEVPTGYKKAADVYFKLYGTYSTESGKRFSRIVLCDEDGKALTDQNTAGSVYGAPGVVDGQLNMVDETIIAPVNLQKVVGTKAGGYADAAPVKAGEVEFTVTNKDDNTVMGIAVTTDNGTLVWKADSITAAGVDSKLIYDTDGHLVTSGSSLNGKILVLRQNTNGYEFKETYSADRIYNSAAVTGETKTVAVDVSKYELTCTGGVPGSVKFINVQTGSVQQLDGIETYKNELFKATLLMYKYDADDNRRDASNLYTVPAMKDVQFTLTKWDEHYNTQDTAETRTIKTDANGLLTVSLDKKGYYKLVETKQTGYLANSTEYKFHITDAEFEKLLTYDDRNDNAKHVTELEKVKVPAFFENLNKEPSDEPDGEQGGSEQSSVMPEKMPYAVANNREMGSVTLTKKDKDSLELLNGVKYELYRKSPAVNTYVDGYVPTKDGTTELTKILTVETGKTCTGTIAVDETSGARLIRAADAGSKPYVESVGTDNTGKLIINNLPWGTYVLTEVRELSGYVGLMKDSDGTVKSVNTYEFVIDATVTSQTVKDGKDTGKDVVTSQTNTKNQATFYKTNMLDTDAGVTTIKALAGAKFEVHLGNGCTAGTECTLADFYRNASDTEKAKKTDDDGLTVTTGADGKVTVYGLPTQVDGNTVEATGKTTYHLVEKVAPKGYKLSTTPTVFTMDRQGNVTIVSPTGILPPTLTEKNIVPMQDEPIKVYLHKFGEGSDESDGLAGAVFELKDTCQTCDNNRKLADGSDSMSIITVGTKQLIDIEKLIGGHTYTLTETATDPETGKLTGNPAGYECTAVVTFTLKTDGTIAAQNDGKYLITDTDYHVVERAAVSDNTTNPVINIHNELIRATLTKVDSTTLKLLKGVTYTLTPESGSSFGIKPGDMTENVFTAETNDKGQIVFPDGLLKYGCTYLLQETASIDGYYLSNENREGVKLEVNPDGSIQVIRLDKYENPVHECLTKVTDVTDSDGVCHIQSMDYPAVTFDLTKLVEGNMGDLNGTFPIKLNIVEPDGSNIGARDDGTDNNERLISVRLNQNFDSVNGLHIAGKESALTDTPNPYGEFAIPVGATLTITENNMLDYAAIIRINGNPELVGDNKGIVSVVLDKTKYQTDPTDPEAPESRHIAIELVNKKDLPIDVGVLTERQAPLAFIALIIPAAWLGYRYMKKRVGGDDEE